jgi:hypothetical protein
MRAAWFSMAGNAASLSVANVAPPRREFAPPRSSPLIRHCCDSSASCTFARRMNLDSRAATDATSSRGSTASRSSGASCSRRSNAITRPCGLW